MTKKIIMGVLVSCLWIIQAQAVQVPKPGQRDPRIKTFTYDRHDAYTIVGHFGYATTIHFSDDETIVAIPVGDAVAWQITPIGSPARAVTIKPMAKNAFSNMTVITDKRTYVFELQSARAASHRSGGLYFDVRFRYPELERLAAERKLKSQQKQSSYNKSKSNPADWNLDYLFSGDREISPIHVFDDGQFTYFQFAESQEWPAVFQVNADNTESLVNWRREGKFLVVEMIWRQFTLRRGSYVACIFNGTFTLDFQRQRNMTRQAKRDVTRQIIGGTR